MASKKTSPFVSPRNVGVRLADFSEYVAKSLRFLAWKGISLIRVGIGKRTHEPVLSHGLGLTRAT